jgi:DNA-binding transcriptional ArsR family regulator
MKVDNPELFQLHADFCRTLANAKRLMIMALLSDGERSVGDLAEAMDCALPTVSQHLTVLKSKHVVSARKEGQTVYYRVNDPRLMEACSLIRTVLLDGMRTRGEVAEQMDPSGLAPK